MIKKTFLRITSAIFLFLSISAAKTAFSVASSEMNRMLLTRALIPPRKLLLLYPRTINFMGLFFVEVYLDILAIAVFLFISALALFTLSLKKVRK